LQHQQFVYIGIEDTANNRVHFERVVVDTFRDINICHCIVTAVSIRAEVRLFHELTGF